MQDFLKALSDSTAYLFDGAMGSMLYSRGFYINRCWEELNLREPDAVLDIHREYLAAGSDILETNTFGANRLKLSEFGAVEQLDEINRRAVALARTAAGDEAWIAGAIGPLGVRIEPYGSTGVDEAEEIFREQLTPMVSEGIDLVVLETFGSIDELAAAITAVRSVSSLPIVAQMTIGPDMRTAYGHTLRQIAGALEQLEVDVIGLNCSVGPDLMLDAVEELAGLTSRRISCQPNAGFPREVHGRKIYMASPDYMGKYAKRLVQKGVKLLGGCCGTTPDHIRIMAEAVRPLTPRRRPVIVEPAEEDGGLDPVPLEERSAWGERLARGEFVTTIEIVPPKGTDPDRLLEKVAAIRDAGVHAVNVPDGPRAQNRMGALATAVLIQQRTGIEAVLHYCCRDRNLLGMHSDLLGAAGLGLNNLLLITGDPPKMGPYPDATAVFDIDAIGLTNMVSLMNRGLDLAGNPFGDRSRFVIGVGVNPGHIDLDYELRRFDWKVKAGAEYAITQPVFDVEQLECFLGKVEHYGIPIVAGIWPLLSYRNAMFMNNEVPGVSVPEETIDRMRRASEAGKEHGVREGVAIAREILTVVRQRVAGVQVSAPLGRVDLAIEVFEGLVDSSQTRVR